MQTVFSTTTIKIIQSNQTFAEVNNGQITNTTANVQSTQAAKEEISKKSSNTENTQSNDTINIQPNQTAKEESDVKKLDFPYIKCSKSNTCPKETACVPNDDTPGVNICKCVHTMQPVGLDLKCPLKTVDSVNSYPFKVQPIIVDVKPNVNNNSKSIIHPVSISNRTIKLTDPPVSNIPSPSMSNTFLVVIMLGGMTVSLLGLILCFKVLCHRSKMKRRKTDMASPIQLGKTILQVERYTTNPQYTSTGGPTEMTSPIVPIIQRSMITDLQEIGEGFFGKVYKGQLHVIDNGVERVETVAVKMLKRTTNVEAEEDFVREVEIMSSFNHENILSLTGFCPRDSTNAPWMVFEYMPFGDLATVLRNSNHQFWLSVPGLPKLSPESLLSIALQIADGMEYLARQRFVHRDLACRNCLVGSGLVVKIADFGMSRDVYTCDYYKIGGTRMLPIRWMAPESIVFGRFTLESDIWSYGIVLWEIYSYGKQPYFGHSNEEVLKFILDRKLLEVPQRCPTEIADIMLACWRKDPKERITFLETRSRFLQMKEILTRQNVLPLPRPPLETITIVHRALLKNGTDEEDEDRIEPFDDDKTNDSFDDDNIDSFVDNEKDELEEDGYLKPITTSDSMEYWQPL